MAAYRYFAHDDPAPPIARTPAERIQACAYPAGAIVGENIAAGARTADEVMAGWLDSPGHRRNIEAPEFAAIGVGVAQTADGIDLWVQDFGSVVDVGSVVPPPAPPAPPPAPPPGSTAPPAGGLAVTVVDCRRSKRSRRVVACRLRVDGLATPAGLRARLVRRGRTAARGSMRVHTPGAVRLRLTGGRPLPAGRYRLVLRLGDARARSAVRLGTRH